MSRNNGTFKYKAIRQSERDENGFYQSDTDSEWLEGCECYIEKSSPARQLIGTDGQVFTYSYEVYIPKYFKGELNLTSRLKLFGEDGSEDEISVIGIDSLNRKTTIVWG
jgi:hypothetical protein